MKIVSPIACLFTSRNKVPTHALSMGIATILDSKRILLLAIGKAKALAIKKALEGSVTEEAPASILQNHKNVTYLLDQDAASLLA